jgi:hypothetical protein
MYENWHTLILQIKATDPVFEKIHVWCLANFGVISRPFHRWDWGIGPSGPWMVFKNKEDYTLFFLAWNDYVKVE